MGQFEDKINKLKDKVKSAYDLNNRFAGRKWKKSSVDSYGSCDYRIVTWVLEGSPCKGVVIVNYGIKSIVAIDAWGKILAATKLAAENAVPRCSVWINLKK